MAAVLPAATAITLLCLPLLLLLTPLWVHAALDLAGGSVPGGDRAAAHVASDQTVAQLVFGGDFMVAASDGSPLYTPDERGHMRDVRFVLYAFLGLGAVSAALVGYALLRRPQDRATWHGVRRGAVLLIGSLILLGVLGALAFGVLFELFHRLFFPGGNWAFPAGSNLIGLYPYAFWQLSAAALGLLALVGAGLTWAYARRRAERQIWT